MQHPEQAIENAIVRAHERIADAQSRATAERSNRFWGSVLFWVVVGIVTPFVALAAVVWLFPLVVGR